MMIILRCFMKKELRDLIANNSSALKSSDMDLSAVYNVIFSNGERIFCEFNDGFRIKRHTYSEIKKMVETAADCLYEKIGATRSYVGLEMENSPIWAVAFWAILKSGNRPYLINCRHPKKLAQSICDSLDIKYIVSDKEGSLDGEYILVSDLKNATVSVTDDLFENELALSTSATTLKEVVCFYTGSEISQQILCYEDILKEAPSMADHYKGSLKQLAFLPFYHIFGLMAVYFWFSFFGRTFVFLRDYSPETILKTVKRHEVTHIFAVPMLWHTIEKQLDKKVSKMGDKKKAKLESAMKFTTALQNVFPRLGACVARNLLSEATDSIFGKSVKFCISGGSYLRPSAQYTVNALGYPLYNGYGMTEIGITGVELRKRPRHRNLNSIGHPMSSVEYRLDEEGILSVRGSSLCKKVMINGAVFENSQWFCTGDIMECIDGYYYIKGRKGDCVISDSGENINPDTVESIFGLRDCNAFSVLGLGEKSAERLSLVVSVSPYLSSDRLEAVKNEAYKTNESLPLVSQIKDFYFTFDPLSPPTAVKVGRAYLKRAIDSGEVSLTPFSEMKAESASSDTVSPLEERIRCIVCEVLSLTEEKVGLDAHIISDLSATSLQYFSIISKIAEEFGISQYNDKDSFRYTVRSIAEYVAENI